MITRGYLMNSPMKMDLCACFIVHVSYKICATIEGKPYVTNGYKVQFGELGAFGLTLSCDPAPSLKEFSVDNIKEVNILFTPGPDFENLRSKAEFNLVTSRAVQAASITAIKANEDTLDLAALRKSNGSSTPSDSANEEEDSEIF